MALDPAHELACLSIGSVLIFLGLAAAAFGAAPRASRERTPLWFGLFTLLYGVRLFARSAIVEESLGIPHLALRFVDEAINYAIFVPTILATISMLDTTSPLLGALWKFDLVYAAGAALLDQANGRPGSLAWLNPALVTVNVAIPLWMIAGRIRRARWTPGGVAALAGFLVFLVLAFFETYTGRNPAGRDVSIEPLGMLAFVCGLGYLVTERVVARERRLVAVSHELDTARRIQQSILPAAAPASRDVQVAARLLPMTEVAGDFYDFVETGDGAIGVLVADVSGHGVPAAIIASMVKVAFASHSELAKEPGELMTRLNRTLHGKFELAFVTAVYACVDPRARTLAYASAGHPPPLLRRAAGEVVRLEEHGVLVGFSPLAQYATSCLPLADGDCVLFYTDGVTEVEGAGGAFFGDERLEQVLRRAADTRPDALIDSVLGEIARWPASRGEERSDDVTMVAVRLGAGGAC